MFRAQAVPSSPFWAKKSEKKKIFTYHVELLMDSSLIIYLRNIFGSC